MDLVNNAWIYGIWVCGLVDLALLLVLPLLALSGRIDNGEWKAYSNATALFLVSFLSMVSALLSCLKYLEVKKGFGSLDAGKGSPLGISNDGRRRTSGTSGTIRAVLCLRLSSTSLAVLGLCLSSAAEGIIFLGLAFVSIFSEQKYEKLSTVWNKSYLVRLLN
jgi:hypothetical protein